MVRHDVHVCDQISLNCKTYFKQPSGKLMMLYLRTLMCATVRLIIAVRWDVCEACDTLLYMLVMSGGLQCSVGFGVQLHMHISDILGWFVFICKYV